MHLGEETHNRNFCNRALTQEGRILSNHEEHPHVVVGYMVAHNNWTYIAFLDWFIVWPEVDNIELLDSEPVETFDEEDDSAVDSENPVAYEPKYLAFRQ